MKITRKRILFGAIIIKLFLQEMNGAEHCLRSYRLIFVEFRVLSDCCLSCHWFVDKNAPDNSQWRERGGGGVGTSFYILCKILSLRYSTII
jgi:hypothetical protein